MTTLIYNHILTFEQEVGSVSSIFHGRLLSSFLNLVIFTGRPDLAVSSYIPSLSSGGTECQPFHLISAEAASHLPKLSSSSTDTLSRASSCKHWLHRLDSFGRLSYLLRVPVRLLSLGWCRRFNCICAFIHLPWGVGCGSDCD